MLSLRLGKRELSQAFRSSTPIWDQVRGEPEAGLFRQSTALCPSIQCSRSREQVPGMEAVLLRYLAADVERVAVVRETARISNELMHGHRES